MPSVSAFTGEGPVQLLQIAASRLAVARGEKDCENSALVGLGAQPPAT